jgi:hypothetical protein
MLLDLQIVALSDVAVEIRRRIPGQLSAVYCRLPVLHLSDLKSPTCDLRSYPPGFSAATDEVPADGQLGNRHRVGEFSQVVPRTFVGSPQHGHSPESPISTLSLRKTVRPPSSRVNLGSPWFRRVAGPPHGGPAL